MLHGWVSDHLIGHELGDEDEFVALRTAATGTETSSEEVAIRTAPLAVEALAALGAFVDQAVRWAHGVTAWRKASSWARCERMR